LGVEFSFQKKGGKEMGYKIRVKIEIIESSDEASEPVANPMAGMYEQTLSTEMSENIDECEKNLLKISYEAMRASLAAHMSEASQKRAERLRGEGQAVVSKDYRVDGEVGRIEFVAYYVETANGFEGILPILKGKDRYKTQGFKEIALVHGTSENAYGKSSRMINRIRHQEGATPARTLRDNSEVEGQAIQQAMREQTQELLKRHQFTAEGEPKELETIAQYSKQGLQQLPKEVVQAAIAEAAPTPDWQAKMRENKVPYEKPEKSVALCVDDVNAKRQKDKRSAQTEIAEPQPAEGLKYVHNTVVHIAHGENTYIINGHGLVSVLKMLLAFLLHNYLLGFNLLFFVDGQRTLYSSIGKAFAWFKPFQFILDWYHLDKRCKEYLSMALKGRTIRNQFLEELMPLLWHGCLDDALSKLQKINPAHIKNQEYLDKLSDYFERNRPYIPCYSVRKQLNLANSSSLGEKANDLIVSQRQKHNGMSWSVSGSVALATLAALVRNGEADTWFHSGSLAFRF
jgi:hypothetical protein